MTPSVRNSESGHALVELSLVAFVLFIIAFWSVEISRVLRFQQVATALSRELASVVYRECAADNAAFPSPRTAWPPVSRFDPRSCIPTVLADEFLPRLNKIAPGAVVSVSYYGYDGTNVTRDYISNPSFTRFDPASIASEVAGPPAGRSDLSKSLIDLGVIVIGEVQLPNSNLGIGAGMFATHFTNWLYGVTVL